MTSTGEKEQAEANRPSAERTGSDGDSTLAPGSIHKDSTAQNSVKGGKDLGGSAGKVASEPADTETRTDGKIVLRELDCYDELGFRYPAWKKWWTLSVIFVIQCSMNFNAGAYGSAVTQLEAEFNISAQKARVGQGLFLICQCLD